LRFCAKDWTLIFETARSRDVFFSPTHELGQEVAKVPAFSCEPCRSTGMGAITPLIFPSLATSGPTPLAYLPLVLIPTYFVPIFTVLHLVALIQAQHAR
jgi:hypothetical protein